jgi:hypothetical protein
MKIDLSRQIFEKCLKMKFNENPSIGSPIVPSGRTDMTKLIVAFRNFVDAPKSEQQTKKAKSHLGIRLVMTPLAVLVDIKTLSNKTERFRCNKSSLPTSIMEH